MPPPHFAPPRLQSASATLNSGQAAILGVGLTAILASVVSQAVAGTVSAGDVVLANSLLSQLVRQGKGGGARPLPSKHILSPHHGAAHLQPITVAALRPPPPARTEWRSGLPRFKRRPCVEYARVHRGMLRSSFSLCVETMQKSRRGVGCRAVHEGARGQKRGAARACPRAVRVPPPWWKLTISPLL